MFRRHRRLAAAALAVLTAAGDWPGEGQRLASRYAEADPSERVLLVAQAAAAGAVEGAATLRRGLEDPSEPVVLAALEAIARHRLRSLAPEVAARLSDERPAVRLGAVQAARVLRATDARPGLVRAAGDSDATIRAAAAEAIAALGGDASGALLDRVHDPESVVRVAAVRALGDVGDARAALTVLGVLDDPNPEVRVAAARSLGRIPDPRAVRALVVALGDESLAVRLAALRALASLGDAARDAVTDLASLALRAPPDLDANTRDALARAALEALCAMDDAGATASLARVVRESRDELVLWTSRCLQRAPRARGEALRDALLPLRAPSLAQLELLGEVGGASSADVILDALQQGHGPEVQSRLLRSLGATGDERAPRVLLRYATQGLDQVAESRRGRPCATTPRLSGALAGLAAYRARVGRLPGSALDPLSEVLRAQSPGCVEGAREVFELVGATENHRGAALLEAWLQGSNGTLRVAALSAVGRCGGLSGETLVSLLADSDDEVRLAASDALARGADLAALTALQRSSQSVDPLDRVTAARTLALVATRIGAADAVAPLLGEWSRGRDGPLARAAFDGLARLAAGGSEVALRALAAGSARALEAVGNAFAGAPPARREALRAALPLRPLGSPEEAWSARLRPDAEDALVSATRSPRAAIAANAAAALAARAWEGASIGDPVALCERWRDSADAATRGNLGAALVRAGAPCTREVLLAAGRADEAPSARLAVCVAAAATPSDPARASALRRCAMEDPSPTVAARCAELLRGAALGREDLDLHVRAADGEPATVAVRVTLADGLSLALRPDADGWLRLRGVAAGPFTVTR